MSEVAEVPVRVPLTTLETIAADGSVSERQMVHCPRQGRLIDTGRCGGCPHRVAGNPEEGGDLQCLSEGAQTALSDRCFELALHRPVRELLGHRLVCIREGASLDSALKALVEHGFGGLPVVDEALRPVGVLSLSDLAKAQYERLEDEEDGLRPHRPSRVGDLMTPGPLHLRETARISEAAALMAFHRLHRLFVVAGDGTLIGVITTLDLARWLARQDSYAIPELTGPRILPEQTPCSPSAT